ncbi:FecCD family ABC transporter permease [Kineosporia babensis]|uniref:Iron ABC transporter permease n=1 Tax=Kineosporia babensis TaxID=499548 RepID=A0A9X1SVQ3_9ACTN|nr:iron ABC transporter permease [Kineosporia babensis]
MKTSVADPARTTAVNAAQVAIRQAHRRATFHVLLLTAALIAVVAAALGIGPVTIPLDDVVGILAHHLAGASPSETWAPYADQVVWTARTPRVAMAAVAGAALAVAGAILQAVVRNGLADPYVLGLNAGASTGAAFAVLVVGGGSALIMSGSALLGAMGAIALVLMLGGAAGQRGPFRLVLAGLAVGYALTAVTNLLVFSSDSPEAARSVMFWLLGSLATVQPVMLIASAVTVAVVFTVLMLFAPAVDVLASGEDSARSAGLDPERTRFAVLALTSAMVGVVVAAVGGVGFVGLVVPHVARRLVGGRHRAVLPVSALLGAILLIAADTVARTALAPQEMPVGVVTGAVGAPLLLLLLRRKAFRN